MLSHNPKGHGFNSGQGHAWVAGSVPRPSVYGRQPINVSLSIDVSLPLSPSLPFSLKIKSKLFVF